MSEPFDILKRIEGDPIEGFDQHDANVRRVMFRLLANAKENTTMGKMTSESINLLEAALAEWRDTCPGAGWEHHKTSALVSLAMTPGMQKLLELAAIGIAVKQAEDQRHIRT